LLYNVALVNPAASPAPQPSTTLLGLVFQASSRTLLIFDLAQRIVWQAASGVILVPPFGVNGVEFNNEYTEMYVANTAYHSIVEIPMTLNGDGSVSIAGSAAVLTTGINVPDGIAVDRHDNLWVVANQEDEIDMIDPNAADALGETLAKVVAKRGDLKASVGTTRLRGCCFRRARRSALTGKSSMSRTCRCTCLMPASRSRQQARRGRSRSSTTRSPRSTPKSRRSGIRLTPDIARSAHHVRAVCL
jgi:SMP-30/Gluconolactonase/LRE-like region